MKKVINQKRTYDKPSMKVYPLRQKPKLLVGSPGDEPDIEHVIIIDG